MSRASDWASTHLCKGERVYCTKDGKLRTICANLASWTGLTPKWCPLRRNVEASASAGSQESAGVEEDSCDRARSFDSAGGLAQDDGNGERSKDNG